jgi:hypothetical protein
MHAVPIVFDLVQPIVARRRLIGVTGELRLDPLRQFGCFSHGATAAYIHRLAQRTGPDTSLSLIPKQLRCGNLQEARANMPALKNAFLGLAALGTAACSTKAGDGPSGPQVVTEGKAVYVLNVATEQEASAVSVCRARGGNAERPTWPTRSSIGAFRVSY